MMSILDDFRGRQFYGTAELAEEAARILRQVGARQERGKVSDYPDERTVRYYLSEGLIPAPDDKSGLKSVFGFRHLLSILAIKQLQSQHLPIRMIREIIADKPESELEQLLGPEFGTRRTTNDARMFLEGLLMKSEQPRLSMNVDSEPARSAPNPSDQERSAPDRTGSGDDRVRTGSGSDRQITPRQAESTSHSARPSTTWERFELFPGLEINIAANFRLPPDRAILEGVVDDFRRLLLGR